MLFFSLRNKQMLDEVRMTTMREEDDNDDDNNNNDDDDDDDQYDDDCDMSHLNTVATSHYPEAHALCNFVTAQMERKTPRRDSSTHSQ